MRKPQYLDQVDAIDARQHQVDHVELVAIGVWIDQKQVAVAEDVDLHTSLTQVLREEFRVFDVVVNPGRVSLGSMGVAWWSGNTI